MKRTNIDFVKYPRAAEAAENVSKRSLELAVKKGEVKRIYEHDGEVAHDSIKVSLQDIKPGLLQARSIFSHLCDLSAAVSTLDPTDGFGEKVIRGRGEPTLFFSVSMSIPRFFDLAIDNEETSRQSLRREIAQCGKQAVKSVVDFGDGVMMIMPIFRVTPIILATENLSGRLKRDCENMGLPAACVGFEVEFLKELFRACFPGATGHSGYTPLSKAFYAKFRRTVIEMKSDIEEQKAILRFKNPRTNTYFELPDAKPYYKMILYVVTHISSNLYARSLTLEGDKLIEVLARTCPSLLETRGGKLRIRNIYDAKLFVDKSMCILNAMGRRGFCEHTPGVSERSRYFYPSEGGFGIEIFYNAGAKKQEIPIYRSDFIDTDVIMEPPF